MKKEYINKQVQAYEEGHTSLAEEQELLSLFGNSDKEEYAWFKFLKSQKSNTPVHLQSDIWTSIQEKENQKRSRFIRIGSIAASVVLALSLSIGFFNRNPEEMTLQEKEAVLKEAMALIPETQNKTILGEIIYENEILIIYTK